MALFGGESLEVKSGRFHGIAAHAWSIPAQYLARTVILISRLRNNLWAQRVCAFSAPLETYNIKHQLLPMDSNALSIMIQELGEHLGLSGLELDETAACYLRFDDLLLCLEVDTAQEKMMIYAPVAELPETDREDLLLSLLKANLFWGETDGATLAVSLATNKIILQGALPLASLTSAALSNHLESFVNQAESWSVRLASSESDDRSSGILEVRQFV